MGFPALTVSDAANIGTQVGLPGVLCLYSIYLYDGGMPWLAFFFSLPVFVVSVAWCWDYVRHVARDESTVTGRF